MSSRSSYSFFPLFFLFFFLLLSDRYLFFSSLFSHSDLCSRGSPDAVAGRAACLMLMLRLVGPARPAASMAARQGRGGREGLASAAGKAFAGAAREGRTRAVRTERCGRARAPSQRWGRTARGVGWHREGRKETA